MMLGRVVTLVLAIGALLLGIGTFTLLSGGSPFGPTKPGQVVAMVLVNVLFLLLLLGSVIGRLVRVWAERRRGSAGSRLHVRLVLLFSVTAVLPALLVAVFAAVFFNLGIQAWFSDRVRSTLEASLVASRAYLDEHRNTIRADALAMAADLNRNRSLLETNQYAFARILATHTALRGLTDSVVFEPTLNQVVAHAGLTTTMVLNPLPAWAMDQARNGDVAVLPGESEEGRVRALVELDIQPGLMLLIGRPVDPGVIEHMQRTEMAFQQYDQLDRNRSGLQITFAMIFAIAALLVLLAAVSIGLVIANQIARPLSRLIVAADRVRGGDLTVRVTEGEADDEVGSLSRAFNRMTNQLAAQRSELMEAYRQIDERRRFTETVLSGVSAGVVGLDAEARINLPNRRASELLGRDLDADLGVKLAEVEPEFVSLLEAAMAAPERSRVAEIRIGPPSARRTLLAQIGAEMQRGQVAGYVLTFDDITELLSAQRKAAWSDVARRIAHEIKNPLTPIQLSAERLKRRYLKEIQSDPETFKACTDTIVRQVEDIGRMVDEFSAFARMPQPVMRPEDPAQVAREALVLQQNAHHDIVFSTDIPPGLPRIQCDRRLLGQALTNLLANAADAVHGRQQAQEAAGETVEPGHIRILVERGQDSLSIAVEDDGTGLPQGEERERITEPYVTHKPKGTGLGLAIVKKIMEDHGGRLVLTDRDGGMRGTRATLSFPLGETQAEAAEGKMTEVQQHGA
ncbi:HAMP domain-containing protein [Pseudoroseomonas wenyumeiae]|uniref:histidine kinase n=1 Tax=Teichococcus wenyumeiae TaxID=2478470 RepID=A0A3A9JI92_9PROT|nr:PAS domain-containing sensor histidine kinase [Pseudoroseomonas wenyumeiae]RKK04275.1 PAS domain-containing sensor histidine kinase [Pseudoroseomonas wenyumeiae]RMI19212.1 HAMP domain-containing protein [Pseudoroseomonas wenyumeiae]